MTTTEKQANKGLFSGASGWLVTALAAAAILGVSLFIQRSYRPVIGIDESRVEKMSIDKRYVLQNTKRFVDQKAASLIRYNGERTLEELLEFFGSQTNVSVSEDAFDELSNQVVEKIIPLLWERCGQDANGPPILHRHMHRWIQKEFPHETLTNADVIFFPNSNELRIVVSEPNSDYFRDSAWHWKWIGQFAKDIIESKHDAAMEEVPLEMDVYAAEELSEFLSVLAVAVIEIAARDSGASEIRTKEIRDVFDRIAVLKPEVAQKDENRVYQRFLFSETTKRSLLEKLPNPMFRDVTEFTGIEFVHRMAKANAIKRTEGGTTVGFGGGGVSINDFDNDGDQDVYFAGDQCGALFENEKGNFSNITEQAGIQTDGESRAGYFVDYDNDGDNDLFITRVGLPHLLLQNDGSGKFRDVAPELGLASANNISHEAVWCDINNDGLLDVYVANFGDWLGGARPTIGRVNTNGGANELFLQHVDENGKRSFKDVAKSMGADDRGWSHCVGAYDFDRDGWLDLFSLNDFGASKLFRNLNGEKFEEISAKMHVDNVYNAMNFTLMDLKHNGELSVYISQIMKLTHRQRYKRPTEQTEVVFNPDIVHNMRIVVNNCLITAESDRTIFEDEHNVLIEPAELGWAWGITAYDYENDSDIDLLVANGTEPSKYESWEDAETYVSMFSNESNVCYAQEHGYMYDVSSINPVAYKGNSRCAMALDFDDDGDEDLILANYASSAQVFENLNQKDNNWIRLKLVGTTSNRNAIGARVELKFSDKRRFGQVVSRSGFLSQPSYELHFGLADSKIVDEVTIHWPSGEVQTVNDLTAGKLHEIREPQ